MPKIPASFMVSVILPVYNSEASLPRALDSLRSQTILSLEVLVINDGSKGNCDEIIRRYEPYLNINYIKLVKNYGRLIARMEGLKNANGEYVGFLDADDTVEQDMYLKLYDIAKKDNADIVHCLAHQISNETVFLWEEGRPLYDSLEGKEIFQKFLNYELAWSLWDKLFKRDIVLQAIPEIIYDRVQLNEDTIIACALYYYASKYITLNERLYNYYINNEGAMRNITTTNAKDLFKVASFVITFCKRHRIDFRNKLLIKSLCQWPFDVIKKYSLANISYLTLQTVKYSTQIGAINLMKGFAMSIKNRHQRIFHRLNIFSSFKVFIKGLFRDVLGFEIIRVSQYESLTQQANYFQLLIGGAESPLEKLNQNPILKSWLDYFSHRTRNEIIDDVEELIEDTDDLSAETVKEYIELIWRILVGPKKDYTLFTLHDLKHAVQWESQFLNNIQLNYGHKRNKLIQKYNLLEDTLFPNDIVVNGGIDALSIETIKSIRGKGTILDCGAFRGETAAIYCDVLSPNKIIAFEPVPENYEILYENINRGKLKEFVVPLNYGVYNQNGNIYFNNCKDSSSIIKDNPNDLGVKTISLQVRTIDSVIEELNVEDIRLIKFDVEDSEVEALEGGEKTIKRDKPILLVSIYHSADEFFKVKKLLLSWGVEYKFMIRNMDPNNILTEKMLIAVPKPGKVK